MASHGGRLHPPRDPADARQVREDREDGVAAHGQTQHETVLLAVLRHVPDVGLDRVARPSDAHPLAVDAHLARVVGVETEDGAGDLGAPSADEAGQAKDSRRHGP